MASELVTLESIGRERNPAQEARYKQLLDYSKTLGYRYEGDPAGIIGGGPGWDETFVEQRIGAEKKATEQAAAYQTQQAAAQQAAQQKAAEQATAYQQQQTQYQQQIAAMQKAAEQKATAAAEQQRQLLAQQRAEEEGLFAQYGQAIAGQEKLPAMYGRIAGELGLPAQQEVVGGLRNEILRIEGLLEQLPKDITAQIQGTFTTESQRRLLEAARTLPLAESLSTVGRAQERATGTLGELLGALGTQMGMATAEQQKELLPLQQRLSAFGERAAREISGYTQANQTELDNLMQGFAMQRELTMAEQDRAHQLAVLERQYARELETLGLSFQQQMALTGQQQVYGLTTLGLEQQYGTRQAELARTHELDVLSRQSEQSMKELERKLAEPDTEVVTSGGRVRLVNKKTGAVIADLGASKTGGTGTTTLKTQVIEVGGRKKLINTQTGETIMDLGAATGGEGESFTEQLLRQLEEEE